MTKNDTPKSHTLGNVGLFTTEEKMKVSDNLVPINLIDLPEQQPRKYFNPEKELEMVNSIKIHGILEPLLVRPIGDRFELVAGERRLRAAKIAGLTEVPITSRNWDDQTAKQISLIENLQREDLSPLEETEAILELIMLKMNTPRDETIKWLKHIVNQGDKDKIPVEVTEVFENLSMALTSFVQNRLPLLKLPKDTLNALTEGKIEYTKALEIGKIKDLSERQEILEEVIKNDPPLKEIKEKVKAVKEKEKEAKADKQTPKADKKGSETEKLPTEDHAKILASLSKKVGQAKPWTDPNNKKQFDQLVKIMRDLLNATGT
jgi:ParB family transcriptional regulator, chromosome partitioning protein